MKYLCAIFLPPLYFLIKGKWGAFFLNGFLCGLALIGVLTIVGIPVAVVLWILAIGHASWHLRRELMTEHAELIASKMAEKMNPKPPHAS